MNSQDSSVHYPKRVIPVSLEATHGNYNNPEEENSAISCHNYEPELSQVRRHLPSNL